MVWQAIEGIKALIPILLLPWLASDQSMTQEMRNAAGEVSVQLLSQSWQLPTPSEAKYLDIDPSQKALIREVYLSSNGIIWAYARTVMPAELFVGKNAALLAKLDATPLGDVLFTQPGVKRQQIEAASFKSDDKEFQQATQAHKTTATELWGRRAKFFVFGSVLSVSEIIFPEIPQHVG